MPVKDKYGNKHQYRGGGPRPTKFFYSYADLRDLFNVHQRTLERWIEHKKLNPKSLLSICKLYNTRPTREEK